MNKARQIYNMILIEIQGHSKEEAEDLGQGLVQCDPIYEKIVNILNIVKEFKEGGKE